MSRASGAALLGCLALTVASGVALRTDQLPRVAWQPEGRAFSIWGLIYACIATTGALLVRDASAWPVASVAFLCASLVLCALWIFAVNRSWYAGAVAICAAAATAFASLWVARPTLSRSDLLVTAGPALLSGWLTAAAAINVAFVVPQQPSFLLIVAAATGAVGAAATGAPLASLAQIWAVANVPTGGSARTASGALGVLGLVGACWVASRRA